MKRHIFFINDLAKLVPKKDSSLFVALTLQQNGHECYLLFESDYYYCNSSTPEFKVHKFNGEINAESFYLESFKLDESTILGLKKGDFFHMRIDPPFDTKYLRYLWMQKTLQKHGVKVINQPESILLNNEKIIAAEMPGAIPNYIGTDLNHFISFIESNPHDHYILKPIDLYQGIGVEKVSASDNLKQIFQKKVNEYSGPVLAQPFIESVEKGEVRACFFAGQEIGSIIKIPPQGNFLANIAQGASFEKIQLNQKQYDSCKQICDSLPNAPWLAFDILDDYISEVNITCPGLLVEVSSAHQKNVALDMLEGLS